MAQDNCSKTTEIITRHTRYIKKIVEILSITKSRVNLYVDSDNLNAILTNTVIKETCVKLRRRGISIRCISKICNDNLSFVRKIRTIVQDFRHLDVTEGFFIVSDTHCLIGYIARSKGPKTQVIVSNIDSLVKQQRQLFDLMWDKSTHSDDKIKEIQQGKALEVTETILEPEKMLARVLEMVGSAKEEILGLFSTPNAFLRQERAGSIQLLKEFCRKKHIKAKILTPRSKEVEELRSELKQYNIDVKYIQEFSQTKISMLLVDRKRALVVELKNDAMMDTSKAVGISTYSTRIMTVLSYVSIHDSYWRLSEMYEESENELAYTKEYLDKVLTEMDNIHSKN